MNRCLLAAALLTAACAGAQPVAAPPPPPPAVTATDAAAGDAVTPEPGTADGALPVTPSPSQPPLTADEAARAHARPAWLGTRVLPLRPDGLGQVQPTPPELVDRRLTTADVLPPPGDARFAATVDPVPAGVAARSTWDPACPVTLDDLRYVTVTFWGFDGRAHTGELLVNARVAQEVVNVFAQLHAARFPIEEMRIVAPAELDAPPTGDGNNTTAFVCRPVRTGSSWSQHAYGLAVDVNPFHNPYHRGDIVLPELASAYLDRDHRRPGMIHAGDPVTAAFGGIGWGWGGAWSSLVDYMHFSASGR